MAVYLAFAIHTLFISLNIYTGLVFGPLLFSTYTFSLGQLIETIGFQYQFYPDDTQMYIFGPDVTSLLFRVSIGYIHLIDFLKKINMEKPKFTIFTQFYPPPPERLITVNDYTLSPVPQIFYLRNTFDSTLSFEQHIQALTTSCFLHLKNIS